MSNNKPLLCYNCDVYGHVVYVNSSSHPLTAFLSFCRSLCLDQPTGTWLDRLVPEVMHVMSHMTHEHVLDTSCDLMHPVHMFVHPGSQVWHDMSPLSFSHQHDHHTPANNDIDNHSHDHNHDHNRDTLHIDNDNDNGGGAQQMAPATLTGHRWWPPYRWTTTTACTLHSPTDSIWTPHGLHLERNLTYNFVQNPSGLHMEFTYSILSSCICTYISYAI